MHAFTLDHHLPNDNDSGMGAVIREDRGIIIKMYSGIIKNLIVVGNELWLMVIGLRGAIIEEGGHVIVGQP